MISVVVQGLLTGLGLIVAIGVQNALVLRQGLRREHVGIVVLVCMLGDIILIAAGTAGMGALASSHPTALKALAWVGAAYLFWCASNSFRSALHPEGLDEGAPVSRGSIVKTVMGVTWLNPHVYLDTLVMLGSLAAARGSLKWAFAGGAMLASVMWFSALGFGARALSKPLGKPSVWRVLDTIIGLIMVLFGLQLLLRPVA